MNTINKNLKEFRTKRGITQQQLADELYVTRQCISRWEQGKTLPDINNIEKIATILDCSRNDLVDDNSIKSLTIREAINSKKNRTILWIALTISIVAILGTLISIYVLDAPQVVSKIKYEEYYGHVTEIDYDLLTITLEKYETDELIYLDFDDSFMNIEDNRKKIIGFSEVKLKDKLYVHQELVNEYSITVMDSLVVEELFGVFISATDNEYLSLDEIREDTDVMYINVWDGGSSSRQIQAGSYDYIMEEFYFESIYDIYVSVNPLVMQNEIEIGLITSSGLTITDTIDLNNMKSVYTYEGEIIYNSTDEDYIDNYNVKFNVHVNREYSYSTIEIFEYDKNNTLLNEVVINSFEDLRDFESKKDALYCLLKVNTTYPNNWTESKVSRLYLGESIELYQSDDNGIVFTEWFGY